MAINEALFSSDSSEWETPQDLFDRLNEEFHFDLDVCASEKKHKCDLYFTKTDNALNQPWNLCGKVCWMNPPYGREIVNWISKAWNESLRGATVVCLLPARTDTRWFHTFIWDEKTNKPYLNVEVRLLKGRLKFVGAPSSAPFPSMIVIFKGGF